MRIRNIKGKGLIVMVVAAVAVMLAGCFGIPKGTVSEVKVGAVQLKVNGAGIVKADAAKTTFKIKCSRCGFEPEEITIDTPVAGKPYTQDWTCPKCGNKMKIVIEAVGP